MELEEIDLRQKSELLPAISVRNAFKRYGSAKKPSTVLNGFNMTVPSGCIYGLLGASGCGKTTVLGCIAGLKKLDLGEIRVFGGVPGSKESGIPGPRVGFMPQEIALFGDFTIAETMKYFGTITHLSAEQIKEKLEFLTEFLKLPDSNQNVKTLSGGQQRRVSMAAALIHQPELLILDEPTVGVDPILRQDIWDYLLRITEEGHTTIIITTHYIEEAQKAHAIGLMRGGYLLAEDSPQKLMVAHRKETLEDVFVKLCVAQSVKHRKQSTGMIVVSEEEVLNDDVDEIANAVNEDIATEELHNILPGVESSSKKSNSNSNSNHLKALIWKNYLWFWRNIPMVVFLFSLPITQTVLFYYCVGHDPKSLHISVVNYELEKNEICTNALACNSTRLSCSYLDNLGKLDLTMTFYETEEQAKNSVREGKSWATLVFKRNYSVAVINRYTAKKKEGKHVEYSEVDVYQDISNQNIGTYLRRYFFETFQIFLQDYMNSCGIRRKMGKLPVFFEQPIFGTMNPTFTNFAAPGMTICIIFTLAVALTSLIIIQEKQEGILERSLVSGVTHSEILLAHLLTQSTIMIAQTTLVLIPLYAFFKVPLEGDVILIVVVSLFVGLSGMCFGLLISCICDTSTAASYMALGSFLPIMTLGGVIWPIEGMHYLLRPLAYILPLTNAAESIRSIGHRGWNFTAEVVYTGLLVTIVWIALFLIASVLLIKYKKS